MRTVKCNRDYQPPCAADSNATDCDINAVRQCKELMEVITETERSDLVQLCLSMLIYAVDKLDIYTGSTWCWTSVVTSPSGCTTTARC